jgi:pullulanase/glycogen debranching enzyme
MDYIYDINFQYNSRFYKIRIHYNNIHVLFTMKDLVCLSYKTKPENNIRQLENVSKLYFAMANQLGSLAIQLL